MYLAAFSNASFAQDSDPLPLPPITVGGSSGCADQSPSHGFTAGCTGGGGGGGGTTTPGSGGGFGGGGGGGVPGNSSSNPLPTAGESADCPSDATTREGRALQQIQATLGIAGCIANAHQGVFFLINFPGGATGVYQGTDGECRASHIASEIIAPNCWHEHSLHSVDCRKNETHFRISEVRLLSSEVTLNRITLIVAGTLILIILGFALFIYQKSPGTSEDPSAASTEKLSDQSGTPEDNNQSSSASVDEPGEELEAVKDSVGEDSEIIDPSSNIREPSGIMQAQRAFSGEVSIVEALQSAAREERWGYDELITNLSYWQGLCNAPDAAIRQDDNPETIDSRTVTEIIETLCMDFPSDFSKELSDFASVYLQETAEGTNDWSKRLNSISDLGPESALQTAIIDLSDAIYSGNYAEIANIVWFLGTSGLLEQELNADPSISTMFSDVEVMIAANASIYCARLGGCSGIHPVTLGLCFQFSERPCNNPGSLHHAIEQILTGSELLAFYQMNQGIMSLVSQHRRGDF